MKRLAMGSGVLLVCLVAGSLLLATVGSDPAVRPRALHASRADRVSRAGVRVSWSRPVRGWPSQIAADGEGVVAVSGGRFVTALEPGAGTVTWEAEVPGWLSPFLAPAIDADTVLLSAGDRFVALDRTDGARRWETRAAGEAKSVALVPTPGSGVAAVTATAGEAGQGLVVGRDPGDGTPRWTVSGPGSLDAHLAGDRRRGAVIATWRTADAAVVRAIDAASGVVRWEQRVEPFAATPVVAADVVVVAAGDGDDRAHVRAIGLADGAARWTTPVPASFEPDLVPGVDLDGGEVAVQDHLGTVTLLALGSGAVRWRVRTGVPALGGPTLVMPRAVVVRNEGQEVVVLERSRGSVRTRRQDRGAVPEGMARVGSRVLVAWRRTEPGRIDALEIGKSPSRP